MTNSIRAVRQLPFDKTGLTDETAKNIARLLRLVAEMDLDLEWRDLGETRHGEYRDWDALIHPEYEAQRFPAVADLRPET